MRWTTDAVMHLLPKEYNSSILRVQGSILATQAANSQLPLMVRHLVLLLGPSTLNSQRTAYSQMLFLVLSGGVFRATTQLKLKYKEEAMEAITAGDQQALERTTGRPTQQAPTTPQWTWFQIVQQMSTTEMMDAPAALYQDL